MNQLSIARTDLRTEVPVGWKLTGLSQPKFDGVNFFRQSIGVQSNITFTTKSYQFVQLEYQLYSSRNSVTAIVALDGHTLHDATFPKKQLIASDKVGNFVGPGEHTFNLIYRCEGGPCDYPISQYQTQIISNTPDSLSARSDVGLGVQRVRLDSPNTPILTSGLSHLIFDGKNYYQKIQSPFFTISWPESERLFNSSFQITANQPFRVTVYLNGQVVSREYRNSSSGISITIPLILAPKKNSLDVKVDCLKTGTECATLHNVEIFTKTYIDGATPLEWILITTILITLMLGIGKLLGIPLIRVKVT